MGTVPCCPEGACQHPGSAHCQGREQVCAYATLLQVIGPPPYTELRFDEEGDGFKNFKLGVVGFQPPHPTSSGMPDG